MSHRMSHRNTCEHSYIKRINTNTGSDFLKLSLTLTTRVEEGRKAK